MKTLIFLDDERHFHEVSWIDYQQQFAMVLIYRTAQNFIDAISGLNNIQDYVFSFDHNIQSYDEHGDVLTSDDCVQVLCERILEQQWNPKDLNFIVHSQNPNDRVHIEDYIYDFMRHCS